MAGRSNSTEIGKHFGVNCSWHITGKDMNLSSVTTITSSQNINIAVMLLYLHGLVYSGGNNGIKLGSHVILIYTVACSSCFVRNPKIIANATYAIRVLGILG